MSEVITASLFNHFWLFQECLSLWICEMETLQGDAQGHTSPCPTPHSTTGSVASQHPRKIYTRKSCNVCGMEALTSFTFHTYKISVGNINFKALSWYVPVSSSVMLWIVLNKRRKRSLSVTKAQCKAVVPVTGRSSLFPLTHECKWKQKRGSQLSCVPLSAAALGWPWPAKGFLKGPVVQFTIKSAEPFRCL